MSLRPYLARIAAALSALLLALASLSSPRPLVAQSNRIVSVTSDSFPADVRLRLGDIPVERLPTTALRVARLRATPTELQLKLGDTLDLREVLRVLALDSTGRSLGTLPIMDTRFVSSGAARLEGVARVFGITEGEAMLRLAFPRALWKARSDSVPHIDVLVRITKEGPSSPVISPMLRNAMAIGPSIGSGTGGCQLDASRRVECTYIDAAEGSDRDRRHWLRAVVLARSDTGARRPQGPMSMQDQQVMSRRFEAQMMSRMASQNRGRMLIGGTGDPRDPDLGFEVSQAMDTIFVADQAFAVPRRDSALVILVDRHDRQRAPTIVGTAMIPSALPADFWSKMWRNGDTTFVVSPKRDNTYLRDALTAVPAIRAFLP